MELRVLNIKTGEIKFVEKHIAENAKLLKSYGYIKQDLGTQATDEIDTEKLKAKYEELTGKKAGNKRPETIAKEIEELTK